jgi:hypothetical protein
MQRSTPGLHAVRASIGFIDQIDEGTLRYQYNLDDKVSSRIELTDYPLTKMLAKLNSSNPCHGREEGGIQAENIQRWLNP